MKVEKIECEEDFKTRCAALIKGVMIMNITENHSKVWLAVISSVLIEIFAQAGDIDEGFKEFTNSLKIIIDKVKDEEEY